MSKPPPSPLYPKRYDSDETLFLVYNTSESILSEDCPAWSEEISVLPIFTHEVWADSGYASIDGELFYYNSVERSLVSFDKNNSTDESGSSDSDISVSYNLVTKFKGCVRNLGGTNTKFNKRGTKVRGFVIAEHHNQLADAIINTQSFIGYNFTEDQDSLDWKIRNLAELPVIFDDHACADVEFIFNIIDQNNITGIIAQYQITINNPTLDTNFILDFGDGSTNNFLLSGTHIYAINANIDPVLTVSNSLCSITITPTERLNPIQPVQQFVGEGSIEIPIPPPPVIPPITISPFVQLDNKYNIPPIVFPCLDAAPITGGFSVPSVIEIVPPLNVPTLISISPITIPTRITISPSSISIPTFISISPITIPSRIEIPTFIQISAPNLNIPTFINISPISIPSIITITSPTLNIPTFINISPVNIPSIIKIESPITSLPTYIKIDAPIIDIPTFVQFPDIKIPSIIAIPDIANVNIPTYIKIDPVDFNPPVIPPVDVNVNVNLTGSIPPTITVTSNIPPIITVEDSIPDTIYISGSGDIPTMIYVDWAGGTPPQLSCIVTVECGSTSAAKAANLSQASLYNQDYVEMDVSSLGIPSVISVESPIFPKVKFDVDNIPTSIQIGKIEGISEIKITQDYKIPSEIKIINDSFIPTSISVDSNIPEVIQIKNYDIPEFIPIKVPEDFPREIFLNASGIPKEIQVVGVPSVIQLQGYIPSTIQLLMPENPEIELVYKGAPIDVKVELDLTKLSGEGNKANCVSIVPCQ